MITRNFINVMATMLQARARSTASYYGGLPVKKSDGNVYYLTGIFGDNTFPYAVINYFQYSGVYPPIGGISLGYGTSAPTIDDYKLEYEHLTGYDFTTVCYPSITLEGGQPCLTLALSITYTGSSAHADAPMPIGEIGYYQVVNVAPTQGAAQSAENIRVLFDRTVLPSMISVNKDETKTITYKLKTLMAPSV